MGVLLALTRMDSPFPLAITKVSRDSNSLFLHKRAVSDLPSITHSFKRQAGSSVLGIPLLLTYSSVIFGA